MILGYFRRIAQVAQGRRYLAAVQLPIRLHVFRLGHSRAATLLIDLLKLDALAIVTKSDPPARSTSPTRPWTSSLG
jgi:hypothetical protein